jgi:hypothetical protein
MSEVSFDSNERDFMEEISWDTESEDMDFKIDDDNFQQFVEFKRSDLNDNISQESPKPSFNTRSNSGSRHQQFNRIYDYDFHNFNRHYVLPIDPFINRARRQRKNKEEKDKIYQQERAQSVESMPISEDSDDRDSFQFELYEDEKYR